MITSLTQSGVSKIRYSFAYKNNLHGIHMSDKFNRLISFQRNLSNRYDHEFSLLVLYTRSKKFIWKPDTIQEIIRRSRSIDEIGWFDSERIGILLPHTSVGEANKITSSILFVIENLVENLEYFIFSYPSKDSINVDGKNYKMSLLESNEQMKSIITSKDIHLLSGISTPIWKRSMDIAGAAVCLTLLLPIITLTAILVKVSSKGPILFKQNRIGLGAKPFKMYKFRSMIVAPPSQNTIEITESEDAGPFILKKVASDPRITTIGRFIRKWSLDELPQLFNVLNGDMSLVGPRPLVQEEAKGCTHWHESRFTVKPGLTCIWQVNGRSGVKAEDRSRMDIRYIQNFSFMQDIKLLFLTPLAVFRARGAH